MREEDPRDPRSMSMSHLHPQYEPKRKQSATNAATGASAASIRALTAQLIAFYFRAPAKAFFKTRIDYLHFARAINPNIQANERWSWRMSTPALLAHAIRAHGWGFVPNQLLPPLVANVGLGAILYTSYLQILSTLHPPSSQSTPRVYPPAPVYATFTAGFVAGGIQSVAAAPLDALQARLNVGDMLAGQHRSMWAYGRHQLSELGLKGVFAGWGLSLIKESFGYGVFFATFEYVKQQAYYKFLTRYYGGPDLDGFPRQQHGSRSNDGAPPPAIVPHYTIEPVFILVAGIAASLAQQVIQHPLGLLQGLHHARLASTEPQASRLPKNGPEVPNSYHRAYQNTFQEAQLQAHRAGGWRRWLYKGLLRNTLRQVPSTSAGLIVFELFRRRYGAVGEQQRISIDGHDVLLS